MIKKKDYELIAEAYEAILGKTQSLEECWDKMSAPQKAAVEKILHTSKGYKIGDNAWNEDKKTVALSHELGEDAERDIIIDSEGKEVRAPIHSGMHKESKDSIASHATLDPRELISAAANNPHDPFIHGRLAGYRHKVEGRGEGLVPANPHKDGAAQNWQDGFDSILAKDDKAGKKEVEDGKVHTAAQDAAGTVKESVDKKKTHNWKKCDCESCKRAAYIADHVDKEDWPSDMKSDGTHTVKESAETLEEKKKMACGKGCMCGKCPKCKPKKKTLEQIAEEVINKYTGTPEGDEKYIKDLVARRKRAFSEEGEYRTLKPGETLKPGDEVNSVHLGGWIPLTFKKDTEGNPIEDSNWKVPANDHTEYRRKI